jgi:hypothetical protein
VVIQKAVQARVNRRSIVYFRVPQSFKQQVSHRGHSGYDNNQRTSFLLLRDDCCGRSHALSASHAGATELHHQ